MEQERRSAPREFAGPLARRGIAQECHRYHVSSNGCFVLTGGKAEVKELVWLEITLPDQLPVICGAELVNEAPEIGFAVAIQFGYA
jgi:hypothetical protein